MLIANLNLGISHDIGVIPFKMNQKLPSFAHLACERTFEPNSIHRERLSYISRDVLSPKMCLDAI